MLRIGRIDYANCFPIFHALREICPEYSSAYVEGVPSYLNGLLADGDIDICPSSSIEYALNPDRYLILPQLSISSAGPVGSVILFSPLPIASLEGHTILLSAESATSVNLLKIIMKMRYGCSCVYTVAPPGASYPVNQKQPLLLIGDSALRAVLSPPPGTFIYDLGELWNEWTGLPFVFALWLCSREAVRRCSGEMQLLAERFIEAKKRALLELEYLAGIADYSAWIGAEQLLAYWRDDLSYNLDAEHIRGLSLFYAKSVEMGLLEKEPELSFLDIHVMGDTKR